MAVSTARTQVVMHEVRDWAFLLALSTSIHSEANTIAVGLSVRHLACVYLDTPMLGGFLVTTTWRVIKLRMEGSCEYIE